MDTENETNKDKSSEEISVFTVIWSRKWIIIFIMVLCCAGAIWLVVSDQEKLRSELVVALSFTGLDEGHYPDGSVFSSQNLIAPDILKKADIPDVLIKGLSITEVIQPHTVKDPKILNLLRVFKIRLLEPALNQSNPVEERKKYLNAIVDQYRNFLKSRYETQSFFLLPTSFVDRSLLENKDYYDVILLLKNDVHSIKKLLESNNFEKNLFSSRSQYRFSKILNEIDEIEKIDLRSFEYLVSLWQLSKGDKELPNEYVKTISRHMADKATQLLEIVGSNTANRLILKEDFNSIPLNKEDANFYLIKLILENENKAVDNAWKLSMYKDKIDELRKQGIDDVKIGNEVREQLNKIIKSIASVKKEINELNRDNIEQEISKAIAIYQPYHFEVIKKFTIEALLPFVLTLSAVLGVIVVLFIEFVVSFKPTVPNNHI